MKLSSLTLSNYRGFEQLELKFCDDVTVIAGVNGVGKSGILKALRQLLSHFEANVLGVGQDVLLEAGDVQIGKQSMSLGLGAQASGDKVDVQLGRTLIPESKFGEIQERIEKLRQEIRYHPKRSSEAIGKEIEIEFLEDRLRGFDDSAAIYAPGYESKETADSSLPVFAYYSVNRAFTDLPKKLLTAKPLSSEAAHENSLKGGRVNLNDFANWFRVALEGELGSDTSGKKLWKALESTIETILPGFKDLKLEWTEGRLPSFSIAKNGVRFSLQQLSDGERALLALAADLTQRLSLANPGLAKPAKEGIGIVLIDEIELHLHPKWQRRVLESLRCAFPNCQFIATTHSALVLGEVKSDCVRFLEPNEETGKIEVYIPPESFGLDVNRVLGELMGASERNKGVLSDITDLFRLIDDEKFEEAREAMKPLTDLLGEDEPELTRANTLIKFLEGKE